MKRALLPIFLFIALLGWRIQTAIADEIALAQTTQAGQTATYTIELRNDTTAVHDYRLELTGLPEGMTATFTQGGPVLENVTVPANTYGQIALRINVPLDTTVGRYTATFTATRDDDAAMTLPVALNVENTYAVRITSQNVNVNTFSGQEFTFEAMASNTGTAPLTNLALTVNAPPRWIVQVEPGTVAQLEPGGNVNFTMRVLVPATQAAIDQTLTLAVNSDQANSPDASLVVRVQTSPNFFLYAGIISIMAVAGVFVYFRIKGRR